MWRNALFCFEGRLFLSLQQSHLNVIYGDSWRFIQFTGFAPKRCTALGTYFPLSISSLATSKSPDSSACKSKARGKLKASWNILNLKISKTTIQPKPHNPHIKKRLRHDRLTSVIAGSGCSGAQVSTGSAQTWAKTEKIQCCSRHSTPN